MSETIQKINIKLVNSSTVLAQGIQVIKRRRNNINEQLAVDENVYDARISLDVTASDEQIRLLKSQLDRLVDVVQVN